MGQGSDALCRFEEDRMVVRSITTSIDFLEAQQTDKYCRDVIKRVGTGFWFTVPKNGLVCRQSPIMGL